jgi:hypothetical protein
MVLSVSSELTRFQSHLPPALPSFVSLALHCAWQRGHGWIWNLQKNWDTNFNGLTTTNFSI